jgi:hypothetical protein
MYVSCNSISVLKLVVQGIISAVCNSVCCHVSARLFRGPNIFLSILFPNKMIVCSSL